MSFLDKAKEILNKKTQEEKEKEFLEKIKSKVQKKYEDKKEQRKAEEEGYLDGSLSTLDSFHKAFGSSMEEEAKSIMEELEEARKAQEEAASGQAPTPPLWWGGEAISGRLEETESEPKQEKFDPMKDLLEKYKKALTK